MVLFAEMFFMKNVLGLLKIVKTRWKSRKIRIFFFHRVTKPRKTRPARDDPLSLFLRRICEMRERCRDMTDITKGKQIREKRLFYCKVTFGYFGTRYKSTQLFTLS